MTRLIREREALEQRYIKERWKRFKERGIQF
jgi:hypothetical protein